MLFIVHPHDLCVKTNEMLKVKVGWNETQAQKVPQEYDNMK